MLVGKGVEGDQVLLGLLEQAADLWSDRLEARDHVTYPLPRLIAALGVEHLAQGSCDQAALVAASVVEHVSDEVHSAALPRAGYPAGDRGLQSFVVIGDHQLHA